MIKQRDFSISFYFEHVLRLCVHVFSDPERIRMLMFGQSSVRV